MAKKEKRGGLRKNAGRKPSLVKKRKMTISVPEKNYDTIKEKAKKMAKAYEEKCKREQ